MDKNTLIKRREEAETSFNSLQNQRAEYEQKVKDIDAELNRLQGEYRVIGDLIEKLNNKNSKNKVSPAAHVIDARDVEGK